MADQSEHPGCDDKSRAVTLVDSELLLAVITLARGNFVTDPVKIINNQTVLDMLEKQANEDLEYSKH